MVSDKNKENNSSHSLLEIPWEKNESSIQKNTEYFQTLKSTILNTPQNNSQDLFFYSYNFVLPTIFKNFSLPFSHTFSSDTKIKILKEKLIFEIKVFSIEDLFNLDCQNELIFLTGRKKLKSKCKSEQSKKYKEAVLNQKEYFPEPIFYDRIKERIYELQLRNNVNLSFIESSDDLIRELRSLIKSFDKEEYIPKVKKQNTSQSFLNNLLLLIPGVSKNVSKCIGNKFGNFNNMINNIDDLHDIEIISDDKINKRKLTKKQIELIKELLGKK